MRSLRPSLLALLPFTTVLFGCTQDHDLLAPTSSSAGSGAGGSAGASSTATNTGAQGGEGGGDTTTSTGLGGAEPAGPTRLTIVNGINDYDAIRVCFVPYPGGGTVEPWPSSGPAIAFHEARVVTPLSQIAPPSGDVQPFVIGGDLTSIAGKTCDEVLALAAGDGGGGDPPPIVLGPMPVLPGSIFESEKSLLLVFFGCLGGPGQSDGTEGLGCGFTHTPDTPSASLTLVAMSRKTDPAHVALQFVHASAAMQPSDIRITPGLEAAVDVPAAKALALGGLGPKPPFTQLSRVNYGLLTQAALKTYAPNDIYPTSAVFLKDAFLNGGIKDTAFQNGESFTLVALGGYPGVITQSFWHSFTYTMVASDPE